MIGAVVSRPLHMYVMVRFYHSIEGTIQLYCDPDDTADVKTSLQFLKAFLRANGFAVEDAPTVNISVLPLVLDKARPKESPKLAPTTAIVSGQIKLGEVPTKKPKPIKSALPFGLKHPEKPKKKKKESDGDKKLLMKYKKALVKGSDKVLEKVSKKVATLAHKLKKKSGSSHSSLSSSSSSSSSSGSSSSDSDSDSSSDSSSSSSSSSTSSSEGSGNDNDKKVKQPDLSVVDVVHPVSIAEIAAQVDAPEKAKVAVDLILHGVNWESPGVQGIDHALRKCKCIFCKCDIVRGAPRLRYVGRVTCMPASMHPLCILSMPAEFRPDSSRRLEAVREEIERRADEELLVELDSTLQYIRAP